MPVDVTALSQEAIEAAAGLPYNPDEAPVRAYISLEADSFVFAVVFADVLVDEHDARRLVEAFLSRYSGGAEVPRDATSVRPIADLGVRSDPGAGSFPVVLGSLHPPSSSDRAVGRLVPCDDEIYDALVHAAEDRGVEFEDLLLAVHVAVLGMLSGDGTVTTAVRDYPGAGLRGVSAVPGRESWISLVGAVRVPADCSSATCFSVERLRPTSIVVEPPLAAALEVAVVVNAADRSMGVRLRHPHGAYDPESVHTVAQAYVAILTSLGQGRSVCPLDSTSLAGPSEDRRPRPPARPRLSYAGPSAVDLFADCATSHPEHVAALGEVGGITYADLVNQVACLAGGLAAASVRPGDVVGVHLDRSVASITAMLGVWWAGATVLPLDARYPPERASAALSRAAATALITESFDPSIGFRGIVVGPEVAGPPAKRTPRHLDDLAYVLFTSGSTGVPKAVAMSHRSIASQIRWLVDEFALGVGDRVLHRTPISFDASLWEVLAPLIAGAAVIPASSSVTADLGRFDEIMRRTEPTVLQVVPGLLRVLASERAFRGHTSLRLVCAGGEPLPADLVALLGRDCGARLVNLYGPTEACINATFSYAVPTKRPTVPIGNPVRGVVGTVVNAAGFVAVAGAVGELLLGGVQVARGYVGAPGQTAERFVPDPTSAHGDRVYRTGDLVRETTSGAWEFVSRTDDQVKIRGVRTEPDEVAAALRRHDRVADCAVVPFRGQSADLQLAAVLVPRELPIDTEKLRDYAASWLHPAMIPSTFVVVDSVPRLSNGKLDKTALASLLADQGRAGFERPRTGRESIVGKALCEILAIDSLALDDDFVALGCTPRVAATAARRVGETLGAPCVPNDLVATRTVRELTARLTAQMPKVDGEDMT